MGGSPTLCGVRNGINHALLGASALMLLALLMLAGCAGSTEPAEQTEAGAGEVTASSAPAVGAAPESDEGESADPAAAVPASSTTTVPITTTTPLTTAPSTTMVDATPIDATPIDATPDSTGGAAPSAPCRRLDFTDRDQRDAWFVLNDGVMGGRSEGQLTYSGSAAQFSGFINTDGGGFTSIRTRLVPGDLDGVDRVDLRVRGDSRSYELTLRDDVPRPIRLVFHDAPIAIAAAGEWQTVSIPLSSLRTSSAGGEVDTDPFDPMRANEIGIILADGIDGDFAMEVAWVDLCSTDGGDQREESAD